MNARTNAGVGQRAKSKVEVGTKIVEVGDLEWENGEW